VPKKRLLVRGADGLVGRQLVRRGWAAQIRLEAVLAVSYARISVQLHSNQAAA
jgi:hypothetical protein